MLAYNLAVLRNRHGKTRDVMLPHEGTGSLHATAIPFDFRSPGRQGRLPVTPKKTR